MNAYDKSYLEDAMQNLGAMADFAVNVAGISETECWMRFLSSGLAERFGRGDPDIIAGISGTELAVRVLALTGKKVSGGDGIVSISSPQYWAGWSLAYYQWRKGLSFKHLSKSGLDLRSVVRMFNPLHEADLSAFADLADGIPESGAQQGWLRKFRRLNTLTQKELAAKSAVPLRLIRAYEQGTIETAHAEFRTIQKLSRALHFSPPEL